MKRILILTILGLLVYGIVKMGLEETEKRGEGMFAARKKTKVTLPRSRTEFSSNLLGEMAVKMLPEPLQVYAGRTISSSEADEERRDLFFADPSNYESAKRYLLERRPSWEFKAAQERFKVRRFLLAAMAIGNTHAQQNAVRTATELIQTDNFDTYADRMEVTMAMSDRGFLYQAMLEFHPETAKALYEGARGTRMGRVLDIAHVRYLKATRPNG
jgi:hypothetical protein